MDRGSKEQTSFRQVLRPILGMAAAVVINILINRFVGFLKVPLFLDNIGTLLAAVMGGYLPGIIVGYLTNIINMTGGVDNVYYASLSVLIAVAGAFFASKGAFKRFYTAICTIPVFALIGGALGSLLTFLMYGLGIGEGISAPFAHQLLDSGVFTVFWAQFTSDIVIDLVDKAITVIIVFVILKVIPERWQNLFTLLGWRQKPFDKDAIKREKTGDRGHSLSLKITIIASSIMVLIAFVTTLISWVLYHQFAINQYMQTGRSTAQLVAATIDGDEVGNYLAYGEDAVGYSRTEFKLEKIRDRVPEIEYIYVYKINGDGCTVVFDLDTDELQGAEPGEVIPFDASFTDVIPTLIAGGEIDPRITNDTYGWLLTAYEPVRNSNHEVVCYAAVDIAMSDIEVNEISFLTKVASLFIGFFILVLALVIWFANYHLIYPLNAMTVAAKRFAYNSSDGRAESVKRIAEIDIRTNDEIEDLYDSLSSMIAETVEHMEDIKVKGEEISKMQIGLITVLADLVESRDKNTGDHVRKTAAYTRIILRGMKKNGLYPEKVTDAYVEDVANSAPLHDVGKIVVSDNILNKNGRLTDEEFAIMKTHTTAGGHIIEKAMELVSESSYLKIAKDLAKSHHEKWDGSGYPEGLAGEEIPLSARVMAVADVLDALLSKRCYKPPFEFDEAVKIISDGSGTHFDPDVVDAFLDNLDAIHEIAKANMMSLHISEEE